MSAVDLKELQDLVAASDLNLEEYKTKSVSELEALLTQLNAKEKKFEQRPGETQEQARKRNEVQVNAISRPPEN